MAPPRPDCSRSRQQDARAQDVEIAPVGDRSKSKLVAAPSSTERSRSRAERGVAARAGGVIAKPSEKPTQDKAMAATCLNPAAKTLPRTVHKTVTA